MKKQLLVTAGLTACMLTAVCAYPAIREISSQTSMTAAAATTTGGWNFTINGDYCVITGCQNTVQGDVVIPGVISVDGVDLPVTQISYEFYSSNTQYITSLTVPASVTVVGQGAFRRLNNLTSVTFEGKIIVIGEDTFVDCSNLESVTFQEGLMEIGNRAFANCTRLQSITLPSTVSTLGRSAFAGCESLKSITIPGRVTELGESLFSGCTALERVTLENGLKTIQGTVFDKCTALEELIIPPSVTQLSSPSGYSILEGYNGIPTNVTAVTIENPECTIYNLKGSEELPLTVYGYEGSTAQAYCENAPEYFYVTFKSIGEKPEKPSYSGMFGDVDGDEVITSADAQYVLNYYVERLGGKNPSWYEITGNPNAPDAP